MSLFDVFKASSFKEKLSFVLLFVASFCVSIAFTCTGWAESGAVDNDMHWGLWRACKGTDKVAVCFQLDGTATGIPIYVVSLS